jgi:hypothetical protein
MGAQHPKRPLKEFKSHLRRPEGIHRKVQVESLGELKKGLSIMAGWRPRPCSRAGQADRQVPRALANFNRHPEPPSVVLELAQPGHQGHAKSSTQSEWALSHRGGVLRGWFRRVHGSAANRCNVAGGLG